VAQKKKKKGSGCGFHVFFQQFDGVDIVLESWDFNRSVWRNRDRIFNFRNHQ